MKKRFVICFGLMIVIAALIICVCSIQGSAENSDAAAARTPVYESIEIRPDDTLWSISKEYAPAYGDCGIREYIRELKRINRLDSDRINAGMYLIVVSYR